MGVSIHMFEVHLSTAAAAASTAIGYRRSGVIATKSFVHLQTYTTDTVLSLSLSLSLSQVLN